MLPSLLLLAAAISSPDVGQSVQSKNGEFIFSQYPPRALAAGEQGAVRFRAEVERLIAAGELSPTEADKALNELICGQKRE